MTTTYGDVTVEIDDYVATVEIHRPPNNFFDVGLINSLGDAFAALDADPACRVIMLCSEGKHFCAGADFSARPAVQPIGNNPTDLYSQAHRLFAAKTPVVAAVHGGAIGGGLGLACAADFRVGCPEARFSANFARLGFHQGFALTVTLPRIVGHQHALDMLYTGRRVGGEEAHAMGLCDRLVHQDAVRDEARGFAKEIAMSAPLAVVSIRETMREGLLEAVQAATSREAKIQEELRSTEDFREGIRATAERRDPQFKGS